MTSGVSGIRLPRTGGSDSRAIWRTRIECYTLTYIPRRIFEHEKNTVVPFRVRLPLRTMILVLPYNIINKVTAKCGAIDACHIHKHHRTLNLVWNDHYLSMCYMLSYVLPDCFAVYSSWTCTRTINTTALEQKPRNDDTNET